MKYSSKAFQKRIKDDIAKENLAKDKLLEETKREIYSKRKYKNDLFKKIFQPCIDAALNKKYYKIYIQDIKIYKNELINFGFDFYEYSLSAEEINYKFSEDLRETIFSLFKISKSSLKNPKLKKSNEKETFKYEFSMVDWTYKNNLNSRDDYKFFSPKNLNILAENEFFNTLFEKIEDKIKKNESQFTLTLENKSIGGLLYFENNPLLISLDDLSQILRCLGYKVDEIKGYSMITSNLQICW